LSNQVGHWLNNCLDFARRFGTQPCLLCAAASRAAPVCPACQDDLPRLPEARCPRCAHPTPTGEVCGTCLRHPPAFTHAEAVYRYAHPADSLVHALKYRGELALARFLGDSLAARLVGQAMPDLIIPMPLHANRLRERGFNQAVLLARHLSRRTGVPMQATACQRIRDTKPQIALPLDERKRNMRRAFTCSAKLSGMNVALVDDVMTTGASLDELARVVLAAGAASVSVWVVCRTVRS
jgi:ComF family protein